MPRRLSAIPCLAVLLVAPSPAAAQVLLDRGHIDIIDIEYDPALVGLSLGIHDHANDIGYATSGAPGATDWAKLVVRPQAMVTRPAGAAYAPVGVGAGETFWLLPQNQNPNLLYGGMAAEEVPPGTLRSYAPADPRVPAAAPWIKLALVGVRGPGHVSLWQSDSFGSPTFWYSSADGLDDSDAAYVVEGGHNHYNWGFTQAGSYELDFQATAFAADTGLPVTSEVTTYRFEVQAAAVPEPGACLLAGAAAVAAAWRRRRATA